MMTEGENSATQRYADGDDIDAEQLIDQQKSKATKYNTAVAVKTFNEYREYYAKKNNIPSPQIETMNAEVLDHWIGRFAQNARQKSGKQYHPKSLLCMFSGLARHLKSVASSYNILDKHDHRFRRFQEMLDAKMKWLNANGFGGTSHMAEPFTYEDEKKLWECGEFGDHSAEALQNTIYFYNSKLFGLRSKDEHRNLEKRQFSTGRNDIGLYVEFDGRTSKTFRGGLSQINRDPKCIRHYSEFDAEPNIVRMYEIFLEIIPDGPAYLKPLDNMGNLLRYGKQPVGVNTLAKILPKICERAGIEHHTGHCGKVTIATNLFNAGIDEQLIKERTAHSSNAVERYKRTSEQQKASVSKILEPPQAKRKMTQLKHMQNQPDAFDIGFDVTIPSQEAETMDPSQTTLMNKQGNPEKFDQTQMSLLTVGQAAFPELDGTNQLIDDGQLHDAISTCLTHGVDTGPEDSMPLYSLQPTIVGIDAATFNSATLSGPGLMNSIDPNNTLMSQAEAVISSQPIHLTCTSEQMLPQNMPNTATDAPTPTANLSAKTNQTLQSLPSIFFRNS